MVLGFARSLLQKSHPFSSPPTALKLQVLSDLHLEVGQQYSDFELPAKAPYLFLAGDIGRLQDYDSLLSFLKRQTPCFDRIFFVLGNHEFYGVSHPEGLALARRLEQETSLDARVTLLHRTRVDLPDSDVTVLGCSLWSYIPPDASDIVSARVNDFHRIVDWSPATHNAEHRADLAWLREQVESIQRQNAKQQRRRQQGSSSAKRRIVIATHHAPCIKGSLEPRHNGSPINCAFATDLLNDRRDWKHVAAWLFGHTHYSTAAFERAGVSVVSNQRGYVVPGGRLDVPEGHGKGKWRRFDEGFTVEV